MDAVQALQAKPEIIQVIKAYTARREAVYRTFSGYGRFGNGWERRAELVGVDALKMQQ